MIVVMFVQRRVGIGLDFFSVAWALVITVVITRFLGKRIDYERPLGQVVELFRHEITGPRVRTAAAGGDVRAGHVRVGPAVRPRQKSRKRASGQRARTAERRVQPARRKGHDACHDVTRPMTEDPPRPSAARGVAARSRARSGCRSTSPTSRCARSRGT